MAAIIQVSNISKQYRLGQVGTGTLSHDLNSWWHRIRGKEDPYLKIGDENDRTKKGDSAYAWALRDVNFEVRQGEVLGIIGRNGAGKSTLLKILSRTTAPSTGQIKIKGRVASLLEVGTGFHPELTGRENIFLNGAILGMTRNEITHKFDEIVDFAGVERYVDTPVKRYSSGMYVRLAFAVAAHLESEILIVDEVLAVGDIEFQAKCLGKMKNVSSNDGKTVLFVSHNMSAVSQLCSHGLLLKNGTVFLDSQIGNVIEKYLNEANNNFHFQAEDIETRPAQILSVHLYNYKGEQGNVFSHKESITVKMRVKNMSEEKGMRCNLAFLDVYDKVITISRIDIPYGYSTLIARFPGNMLVPNNLKISVAIDIPAVKLFDILPSFISLEIADLGAETGKNGDSDNGIVFSNTEWSIQND